MITDKNFKMKNYLFIFISFFAVLLLGCSEEKKLRKIDVYEIKNIGILSTTEYTIGKIIKLDDNKDWYKFGDRKILISVKAKVKAGVNLMELREEDIKVKGTSIEVYLPPVEITAFEMDPSTVRTEMEDVNGFRMNFSQIEKNKILRLGEKSIRDNLKNTSIIRDGEKNAVAFVENFYKQIGYKEVIVHPSKNTNNEN